jgi:hypothetical protein
MSNSAAGMPAPVNVLKPGLLRHSLRASSGDSSTEPQKKKAGNGARAQFAESCVNTLT